MLVDDSGDGVLSPGESATLTVTMRETAGVGANLYPGVLFSSSSDAGIAADGSNYLYAMLPCSTFPLPTRITVSVDVPLHTKFVVRAKIGALTGSPCAIGDVLDIPVSVGDPLP